MADFGLNMIVIDGCIKFWGKLKNQIKTIYEKTKETFKLKYKTNINNIVNYTMHFYTTQKINTFKTN